MLRGSILPIIFVAAAVTFPPAHAEAPVAIMMEKTVFSYCEKLFYTIQVSEVTGDPAIVHIRDEAGRGSSGIPISIDSLQNPVLAPFPFEKEIFQLGRYFIDVQYSGAIHTAEFELVDSGKKCIPGVIKPIMSNWIAGNISDGFLVDAFKKFVEPEVIDIPYEVGDSIGGIDVPEWMKAVGLLWLEGLISDDELANAVNYLIDMGIISFPAEPVGGI